MAANDDTPEARAIRIAEQRGKDVAEAENRFRKVEGEMEYLKTGNKELKAQVKALTDSLGVLAGDFRAHLEVGDALSKQVAKNSADQVSKKTYILGLVGAVIALGMLLIATVALMYGTNH